ncbi:SDR family oxidoreductase [Aetokthonos hydrillicola Thurmond2011]|jgi:NAD(P)-dependent dehydrogenase (short-subunit alcohol dehydrogenase family)|uniref:SDR family oxidoreductase n=1 Tax=Aetokthonos hydrillicola Thurmond2011 TaxID=2712845 RepID=A0AAP5M7I0_9CYAN|nr:SDR family NAD(P)-dependent oxidoreductase [Aetokthonos hydrillicola]MBO3459990.1 SDR family oxidoreductase [Aetokthonos hydrillicola CCALA 1050]MBW4584587.1 SDR family oxidoreductase [Aetokthonos hydrillicola CCALA 1050]MDR9895130.1 SDR family oxidoreductase [Aetokthonos hydrillicola Thurmond2011]
MELTDKVALVTGAGSGIAKATAKLFAQKGAKVAALGRTKDELEETVSEIQSKNGEAIPLIADVSQPEQMEQATQEIIDKWGRLDIVFANAGINGVWAPIDELAPEEWNKTININLTGTFLTVKYAVPYLKRQGGAIVITSSVNGTRMFSNSGATAYSCTKAAQVAFTKMVALELAKDGIRVNVICPGAIETNIDDSTQKRDLEHVHDPVEFPEGKIPLTHGKPGTSEQVAQLVFFLVSDASRHITGTEVWIDGAESLLKA